MLVIGSTISQFRRRIFNLWLRPDGFIVILMWIEIFGVSIIVVQLLRWVNQRPKSPLNQGIK